MDHLKVAYSCNDGYIMQTGVSIISLLENNKEFDKITVFLIAKDINVENIQYLKEICEHYNRELSVVEFDEIAYDLNVASTGRHIETVYTKIFFSRIPELDKILYIDSDTVINGSLAKLWKINLGNNYMGMVETFTGDCAKQELNMSNNSLFFNDGVALCNVDFCRNNNLIGKCLNVIKEYNGTPPVLSEGVINKVCENRILALSPRYNMMSSLYQLIKLDVSYVEEMLHYSRNELIKSCEDPIIIHYLSGFYNRPWNRSCTHPLKQIFLHYKEISRWKDKEPTDSELPLRIKVIGILLKILGPRTLDKFRKFIKKF